MSKLNLKYGLAALVGMGLSVNVSAADLSCSDIEFNAAAFEAYEFADKACLDMVERNGGVFAKFTATKVVPAGVQQGVSTFIRFTHNDGSTGPRHKSALPRNFLTMIDGRPVRMADLNEGQDVNIYVSPEYWVPIAVIEEMIEEEIVEEMVEEAIILAVEEEIIEEELEAELPTTAGPLPWLALFGSMFLLLGGALRLSRKQ